MMSNITLYGYWRSSAAYRVRIVLNLKGLNYQMSPVHLVRNGGEQHSDAYHQLNPSELVPVLTDGDMTLSQSLAIIEYLDDVYPQMPMIPASGHDKYQVLSLAQDIASDIHPLNNLRVLQYLRQHLAVSEEQKDAWYRHWIQVGFSAFEQKLLRRSGQYCVGDTLSLADVCLVPQVYNAERFNVPMQDYPQIQRITERLRRVPGFARAAPEQQPDSE